MTAIVFVINMAQYAIRGYEVNAEDFIVRRFDGKGELKEKDLRMIFLSFSLLRQNRKLHGRTSLVSFPLSERI